MNTNSLSDFASALARWDRLVTHRAPVPVLQGAWDPRSLRFPIQNLRRRIREGPLAPARLAFFGATGTGKSKLFSSIVGRPISDSGFRRPCTREARYYLHEDWRALAAHLSGEAILHQDQAWRSFVLIDTPDFDSVETSNRAEAERVLAEADGFVFVVDSLKYADASTWDYLRAIHQAGKEFLIALNKVQSDAILPSFLARYQATVARRDDPDEVLVTPIVIPEFRVDDGTLLDPQEPSLQTLVREIRSMALASGPVTMCRLFDKELQGLLAAATLGETLVERQQGVARDLRDSLDRRLDQSQAQLRERLRVSLEPGMREEVFQRVLTRIESLDLLRYPRQILSFPVRALRQIIGGWWNSSRPEAVGKGGNEKDLDPSAAETFHIVEAEVLQFANQVRVDFLAQPGYEQLLTRERYHELRLDHGELQDRYRALDRTFREWVSSHAMETASQITNQNKAKFFLSQLLFNSVLITAQVHTGGLSVMELGLDSVVSPFLAKGVGMLIGNERVKEFEDAARVEHQRLLSQVLVAAHQEFVGFLDASTLGLEELAGMMDEILCHRETSPSLVEAYHASQGTTSPELQALPESAP